MIHKQFIRYFLSLMETHFTLEWNDGGSESQRQCHFKRLKIIITVRIQEIKTLFNDWRIKWTNLQQPCYCGVCILYLYSRSCRSSTGSRPCGFWMGVIRFCFCWSWIRSDVCPGACCCWGCWAWGWDWVCGVRDVLGMAWAAVGAWGGAGDGLPLGAGTESFWELLQASVAWPKIRDEKAVTKFMTTWTI